MGALLRSEWYKFRKSNALPLLLAGPFVAFLIGMAVFVRFEGAEINEWLGILFPVNITYGLLLLPLITGVLAGLVCRYEHVEGGWKQLLTLPVSRGKVFVAKYVFLLLLVLAIQLLYFAAVFAAGKVQGISDPFPLDLVLKSAFGGWVASFPLVALQLWMSIMFKSFAAPFAVNVIFTLPSIMAVQSKTIGPYYPWGQPFFMMNLGGSTDELFFVPASQLLTVVGGSFLLFFACGYLYFQRKAV